MAGFTTMGVMLALGIGGTALNVAGQIKAGNAAKRAGEAGQRSAESQGELADFNADVAELQADDAIARGIEEEQKFRTRVRATIGNQRAGMAAGNIDVGYGSAVDVQADTAFLGELDALTIAGNAAREAWGYKMQAEDLTRRGQIARQEGAAFAEAGRVNQSASRWNAAGSIVTSGSSLMAAKYGWGR